MLLWHLQFFGHLVFLPLGLVQCGGKYVYFLSKSFLCILYLLNWIYFLSQHPLSLCYFSIYLTFLVPYGASCKIQVRRLKEFGVTKGELARYLDALLKDSEQLAAMIDNVSSVDNLDFIMETDALGYTVMDQRQGHESLVAIAGTVTREEVNLKIE